MQQGRPMHAQIPTGWIDPNVPLPSSAHNHYQTTAHAVSKPSAAHEQQEPQGTGVFLPQPQRSLHSSVRNQAKFRHKPAAAAVTPRYSALSHTASDLSCQSSTHDFCLSASESSSTAADLDTGKLSQQCIACIMPDSCSYS